MRALPSSAATTWLVQSCLQHYHGIAARPGGSTLGDFVEKEY